MLAKSFVLLVLIIVQGGSVARDNGSSLKSGRSAGRGGEVLENILNVYDPSFLSVAWPKIANGVHVVLGQECWEDMTVFFKDLTEGRVWAYRAVDASGRYQAGLFDGNRYWLGSKDACHQLDNAFITSNETFDEVNNGEYHNVMRKKKYFDGAKDERRDQLHRDKLMQRLITADGTPPAPLAFTVVQVAINITKVTMMKSFDITIGVCLPLSCSSEDVAAIINFSIMINDNFKASKNIPRTVSITAVRPIEDDYDISRDVTAIILISVTLFLIALSITATVVEFGFIKCRTPMSKSMTFDLPNYNNNLANTEKADNRKFETLTRKDGNVVDVESLTINNINNSNNINLVTVKKVVKSNSVPPSITLDVVSMEQRCGSCKRCGKYRKQCSNPMNLENLPACPRIKNNSSVTSLNKDYKWSHSFAKSLLLCFSLNYSWRRIFNTNMANKDLALIHLLKVLATLWIIFVHVSMIVHYISENGGDINDHNNVFNIVATGTLSFDTLLFVSGVFSAHHFFFLKSQYSVEELVSFGGSCGNLLQYVCFVTNRAIRLLPSYVFVVFSAGVLSRVSRDTAVVSLPERYHDNCQVYWWRNLLFITNLYPRDEQCMQVSWLVSLESTLHAAGALACALVWSARAWLALPLVILLGATAVDVTAAYTDYYTHFTDVFSLYGVLVERSWARVAGYLLGALAGWRVHAGALHVGKGTSYLLWCVSVLLGAGSVACSAWPGWAAAWAHVTWPLALLWPTIVCSTQYAGPLSAMSGALLLGMSRVSYSMLLLHALLARYLLLDLQAALCSNTVCLFSYFSGMAVVTIVAALLLSLLVEMPICSLLRRLSDSAT